MDDYKEVYGKALLFFWNNNIKKGKGREKKEWKRKKEKRKKIDSLLLLFLGLKFRSKDQKIDFS